MTTAQGGETSVQRWGQHVLGPPPTPVVVTIAWAVGGLLGAPRVTAAALARAFSSAHAGAGRSWLRRGRHPVARSSPFFPVKTIERPRHFSGVARPS